MVRGDTTELILDDKLVDNVVARAHELLVSKKIIDQARFYNFIVEGIYTVPNRSLLDEKIRLIEGRLPSGVRVHDMGGAKVFVDRRENGGINIGKYFFSLYVPGDLK